MATRAWASVVQMPLAGSKPTQPRSGTKASAQAWPGCWFTMPSQGKKGPWPKRAGARSGDESMCVVLADTALEREGFHRRGAGVGRVFIEGHMLVDLHHQRM